MTVVPGTVAADVTADPITYAYLVHEVLTLVAKQPLPISAVDKLEGEIGLVSSLEVLASGIDGGCRAWLAANESMSAVFAYEILPIVAASIVGALHDSGELPPRRKAAIWTIRALDEAEGTGAVASHGYICKKCGNPAPVGVGYAVPGCDAARASAHIFRCRCGYSWLIGEVVELWRKEHLNGAV